MMTICWVCVGLVNVCVSLWYLLIFSYELWLFDFCINFFYNKLTPRNFCTVWLVPVMIANLCSWEQNDNNRVREARFFCGAAEPTWWRWDYFGRELCFVNQLLHSWFHDSFVELNKFNYMYEQIYFPLCEWCVLSYYTYTYIYIYVCVCVCVCVCMCVCMYECIHLSNGVLFGECISRKKSLSFFL